ncbi:hypothetical protein [uncultured Algibacter sp.]|uniref:hypothetical protein n=1 Tax=uncultured Algibacter sp. TaxID=298659 RepID=UPI00260F0525|nr:hypothetical protein [uncultured Algibacter sp.]
MKYKDYLNLITIIIMSLNLSNCVSDNEDNSEILETPNKNFMFEVNFIQQQALHNKKGKIIYMFSLSFENQSDSKLIAYNYELKEVIKTKEIGLYNLEGGTRHSTGDFNSKTELYLLSENTIYILSGDTLDEIASINIPDADKIYSVKSKNGLLFISYNNKSFDNKLIVYNRNSLKLIKNDIKATSHQGVIVVYNDKTNTNQIKCVSFPQSSNDWKSIEHTFDLNGNYISYDIGYNAGEGVLLETNDNSNFILKGSFGRVYSKENLMNGETILNNNGGFVDFKISIDGDFIYSIQNDSNINIYNASDFSFKESISINQNARNIFIDGDKLLIINYEYSNPINVYLSSYLN